MTTLTRETVEMLALDVAQSYFNDQQLCVRYGLTLPQLDHVRKQPAFEKELLECKRILEDGGEQFVYRARTMAHKALELFSETIDSDEATRSQKIAAAKELVDIAGVKKKPEDLGGGLKLTINTNLALGDRADTKGIYTIEVIPEHPAAQGVIDRAASAASDLL